MAPRSLFNIILKIFGLFFLREIINTLPQLISPLILYFNTTALQPLIANLIVSIIILSFYTFLVIQLLFKTNNFIDILKLDQGFNEHELSFDQDNELPINLSSPVMLNIALIVIGGIILSDEIPNFCRQFYLYVEQNNTRYNSSKPDSSYMVFAGAKIIIALLIIGERKRIIDFIWSGKNNKFEKQDD